MTRQEKTLPSAQYPTPSSRKGGTIRVGKSLSFPLNEWRDGILSFVDGILHQQPIVLSSPELAVARVRLRLHPQERYYVAYGDPAAPPPDNDMQKALHDRMVRSEDDQDQVERALRYFVNEPSIVLLRIDFPHRGVYWLWKTSADTVCASLVNLPRIIIF